jgi:hypothetical protein
MDTKINLGDEFTPDLKEKIAWIRANFDFGKEQYVLRDIGFLYNDWVVEFSEEKYATLFKIRWS